jgi:hypothetical protein
MGGRLSKARAALQAERRKLGARHPEFVAGMIAAGGPPGIGFADQALRGFPLGVFDQLAEALRDAIDLLEPVRWTVERTPDGEAEDRVIERLAKLRVAHEQICAICSARVLLQG